MRVRDLGPVVADIGDRRVELGATKQAAILSMLALHAGRRVAAETLMSVAWGPDVDVAVSSLDSQVWRLRNVLEPNRNRARTSLLVRDSGGYRLVIDSDDVDSLRFERTALKISRSDPLNRSEDDLAALLVEIDEALNLWRGRPLESAADPTVVEPAAARFEELRDQVGERRIDVLLALGCAEWALADVEPLIAATPYRERLWGQRMTALSAMGRVEEALSSYQRLRQVLDDDLGLEPGPDLKQLQHRILTRDPDLIPSTAGPRQPKAAAQATAGDAGSLVDNRDPPTTRPRSGVHLPRRGTPLIGRIDDVQRLTALVAEQPLVTLVGAAGSGKTRLAVDIAGALADRFADGVWFVDLTAVEDPTNVVDVLTSTLALGVSREDAYEELGRFADSRRILIVLDNCEHVLEAAARCCEVLLTTSGPAVLATSREPLDVDGELLWPLAPLAIHHAPGEPSAAVQLFVERLRAAAPQLDLDADDHIHVDRICRSLDGLPLALELAAAGARWFSLAEIADQVAADPSQLSRFGRRRGDHRDDLYDTIDWSYQLLSAQDQAAHRALSVLPGSFTIGAAAAALAADSRDLPQRLTSLAHRSLLITRLDPDRRRTTFAQLATVRAHAHRQLVAHHEDDHTRRRRDRWVQELLTGRPRPGTPGEADWYDDVDESYTAVRATLQAAVADNDLPLIRLGSELTAFWSYRSRLIEGRRWLQTAHDTCRWPSGSNDLVLVRLSLGTFHLLTARPDLARPYVLPHLTTIRRVSDLDLMAMLERVQGLTTASWAAGDTQLLGLMNHELQLLARRAGDEDSLLLADGVACVTKALVPGAGQTIVAETERVLERAVARHNTVVEWLCCMTMMFAHSLNSQDPAKGLPWLQRTIDITVPWGDGTGSIYLELLGVHAALLGDLTSAAHYFAAGQTYLARSGMGWALPFTPELLEQTRTGLGTPAFEAAWADGEHLTLTDVAHTWNRTQLLSRQ